MKVGKWVDIISGEDHYAIFHEASKFSRDIGIVRQPLILHYADDSIGKVLHKYYRYGRDLQILSHFYPESPFRRFRDISSVAWKEKINLLTLYATRGGAYIMGWLESKLRYNSINFLNLERFG